MHSDTLIKFMKRLIKGSRRKIFLIIDNLKVHHSYVVRNWLEKHKEQIEAFFLPSNSPELNPDEYLNCDLKVGIHSKTPSKTKEQLKGKAISYLRKLQKLPERVKKYFKYPKNCVCSIAVLFNRRVNDIS
jgi:transposase